LRRRARLVNAERSAWLGLSELRIGLGCMRLSTEADSDDARALETVAAAVEAGITVFDTARAYGRDETELGRNERLLARALAASGARAPRIVTKGGMARPGGRWVPDGRARSLRADCEASLATLDSLPIDTYLLHAPDPRVPWRTSVRALARIHEEGLVARIGVANVNRTQLDEALGLAPLGTVQVAFSPFDDSALRGGVVERCIEAGIAIMAHSPLGGPRRAGRLAREPALERIAGPHGATPAEIVLAWLLELDPAIVAIPGARRPETARSAATAARLELDTGDCAVLAARFPRGRGVPQRTRRPAARAGEVVLIMGIPGAGKTTAVAGYVARGYRRLNRDELGGSLRSVARGIDEALASGERHVVLDNTYLTRAGRSHVVEAAAHYAIPTRCVWLDTPLAQAQVNLVERLLDRHGALPGPDELRQLARREPGIMAPTSQMRALRELEPPGDDEGFDTIEVVPFARPPRPGGLRTGVFIAAAALARPGWERALAVGGAADPRLVFDWSPDGVPRGLEELVARLAAAVEGPVDGDFCPHGGGPPVCWCRPPLPGIPLAFARAHNVDPARSALVGTTSAHAALAAALGGSFVAVDPG
jgi:aryl-alcohol dehydrogenase-like predicted oxidoreductase